ncbi:MAG: histidine kinase [Saprospiraceae bacterium]|nr:histidine kinase [Saprospiraceae bacterium]
MQSKRILPHILFWLIIMGLGIATIYPYYQDLKIAVMDRAVFLPVWWIGTYLNWGILMPKLLNKKRWPLYLSILLVLVFLLTVIQRYICLFWFYPNYLWQNPPNPADLQPFLLPKFIQFAAFISLPILCSIGIRYLLDWYEESYKAKQILAQQQAAELQYLKAQINPHFLFNTLNNLYGLSLEASQKVPGMILRLSDILSYSLYESAADQVSLEKEIQLIKDFIALEKERYGDRMQVDFDIDEEVDEQIEIAPLLLIPFVENAFKHGVKEATEAIPIHIQLAQVGSELRFQVQNRISEVLEPSPNKKQGLGLKNLQRRLDLLYPSRHHLETTRRKDHFYAALKLQIDE